MLLVIINPMADGAGVTVSQFSNLADPNIQLVQSDERCSLTNWQARSLNLLMIEELAKRRQIKRCGNMGQRGWFVLSTIPACPTPMESSLFFEDATFRTPFLQAWKQVTGSHREDSLMSYLMCTIIIQCCINLCSFFFFGCKLTVVGMFFDGSDVDLVGHFTPRKRWHSTIIRELLLIWQW